MIFSKLPAACRQCPLYNQWSPHFDGGIADPVPVEKLLKTDAPKLYRTRRKDVPAIRHDKDPGRLPTPVPCGCGTGPQQISCAMADKPC